MDGINPQNAFQQGLQAWQVGANIGQQQQARQMAEQQQQRAQQYKDMLTKVISNPASTAQDYLMLQAQFPEQAKATKDLEAQQSDAENKNDLLVKMQLLNAVKSGDKESLNRFASQQIEAYKNSGRDTKAQGLQMILDQYENVPPEVTEGSLINSIAAQMDNPKDFIDYYDRLQARAAKGAEGLKGRYQPSTEKGPDGTIWAMNDKGEVTVKDITGKVLEGEEARKAWLKSKEYGVDIANRTTYVKESGRLSAQKGTKAEIEEEVTKGKEQAKGEEKRQQSFIDQGLTAGEALPTLKRSLDLLKGVKTGGFNNALIRAKQFFGVEGANEGELSYNLSKNVIGQLKDMFGGAFSRGEAEWLNRIEAGLGRNPATNRAILTQALKKAERKVRKAIAIAKKKGDVETVQELEDLQKFSLSEEASQNTTTGDITQQTTELRTQPDLKSIPVAERLKMLQGP